MKTDAAAQRGALNRLRWLLGVGFGAGYAPVAPGTAGSALGVVAAWLFWVAGGWPALMAAAATTTVVGIWAAEGVADRLGRRDPGEVVVDEIAGQMVALLLVEPTLPALVAGFLLFRVFDIVKPFPARRLEAAPGGLGIMLDDLVAGLYANLALRVAIYFLPELMGAR